MTGRHLDVLSELAARLVYLLLLVMRSGPAIRWGVVTDALGVLRSQRDQLQHVD